MVDLAGSERIKKSRSTGERFNEAKSINSSLSTLGKCIHALSDNKIQFVPFRDSKLTRLLQDSLGGNCKTALICTIGPSFKHVDETISSLSFGQRAMKVQNKPVVNRQKDYTQVSDNLQFELDEKEDMINGL
jgi:kinesin family protein 5